MPECHTEWNAKARENLLGVINTIIESQQSLRIIHYYDANIRNPKCVQANICYIVRPSYQSLLLHQVTGKKVQKSHH